MAVLLGMLAGALLVFGAALAAVWVQELRAARAERAATSADHPPPTARHQPRPITPP